MATSQIFNLTWSVLGSEELPTTAQWHPEPLVRGTLSVLVASLVTLSLCVWTTLHLNIPPHGATMWTRLKQKLRWLLIGIFFPEYVLFIACMQWLAAQVTQQRILVSFAKHGLQEAPVLSRRQKIWRRLLQSQGLIDRDSDTQDEASRDGSRTGDVELGELGATPEPLPRRRKNPWTIRHTHYLQMGGFVFDPSQLSTGDIDNPSSDAAPAELDVRLSLRAEAVVFLSRHAPHLIPDISEANILDKSNADRLSRLLAIAQASWFLVQFIARLCVGLPATLLELNVVAHIFFAVLVFLFWWKKPLDICVPTEVPTRSRKDCSLLAAMYIRSRIGFMRRVDNYHSQRNPHVAFLDLSPPTAELDPTGSDSEGATAANESNSSNESAEIPDTLTPAVPLSFAISPGQALYGVQMVACLHFRNVSLLWPILNHPRITVLGECIMVDRGTPRCRYSTSPDIVEKARITISSAHRRLFELARGCEDLGALGAASGQPQSVIKAYLENVLGREPDATSRMGAPSRRLRSDFVTKTPSDYDIEALNGDAKFRLFGLMMIYLLGSIFGVLHMLAWDGPFHTAKELACYRWAVFFNVAPLLTLAGSLLIGLAGLLLLLIFLLMLFPVWLALACLQVIKPTRLRIHVLRLIDWTFRAVLDAYASPTPQRPSTARDRDNSIEPIGSVWVVCVFVFAIATLYFLARLYFLAESVVNLTYAPPRVFELPNWISYIPHIA